MIVVTLGLFFITISSTHKKIGETFPGYLTFQNGVVGAFFVPDWEGPQHGILYHQIPDKIASSTNVFSQRDFVWVCLIPAVSGLMFFLLGMLVCFYFPTGSGRWPFLLFHFFAGMYVMLTPDFHLTYQFTYLLLLVFSLIPSTIFHFAFLFPEKLQSNRKIFIPYVISFILMIPYLGLFFRPHLWVYAEYSVFSYLVIAYLFWISRLFITIKKPQLQFDRVIAKYLLMGQLISFTVPLIVALCVFILKLPLPLNVASPFILLFPISVFMGLILGKLKQSQMQLLQSEKRAALGSLFAGLAHEINNPMTFVYSAIEPLRESLGKLQTQNVDPKTVQDISEYVGIIEEGATRAKSIVENFRSFSFGNVIEKSLISIHEILDQSLRLTSSLTKDRVSVIRQYDNDVFVLGSRTELGQIFVNLLTNAAQAIARSGTITIRTKNTVDSVLIYINDTGAGMSPQILNQIFDPFFTTKQQGEGTGLGLSITLDMIKKHDGKIEATSILGKGSEFVVTLPRSV